LTLSKAKNGTVEIVDFKSGNKPDVNSLEPTVRSMLDRYKRQLQIYGHLVEERTGYKVSRLHLYYPKEDDSSPYISYKFDDTAVQQTIETFDKVVRKIEKKDFHLDEANKSEKTLRRMRYAFFIAIRESIRRL
jgi:DNA helicase-2/ATP-dependent DNA helicase PcrA